MWVVELPYLVDGHKEYDELNTHRDLMKLLVGDDGELVLQFFVTFSRFR
jgi:hypothetical protein